MGRSGLACPQCGTQFHGSRDVCPFCHQCIHQVGGHNCHRCGVYIPTVEDRRVAARAARAAAAAADAEAAAKGQLVDTVSDRERRAESLREIVRRTLRRSFTTEQQWLIDRGRAAVVKS